MKKPILFSLTAFLLLFGSDISFAQGKNSKPSDGYFISGKLKNAARRKIYLKEESFFKDNQNSDSTIANAKGEFVFKGQVDEVTIYTIEVSGKTGKKDFYLENSKITLTGNSDSLWQAKVSGSHEEKIREKLSVMLQDTTMSNRFERADQQAEKAKTAHDFVALEKAMDERIKATNDDIKRIKAFISTHPNTASGVNLINQLLDHDLPGADSMLTMLENFDSGKKLQAKYFRQQIDLLKKLAIGKIAPDFTQQDTLSEKVTLSSFRGKYVLIDFWASWCGPCREENPNLLEAYKKYQSKNFDIISVSLDEKRESWLKAIKKDSLYWTNLSDLKGWKNDVALKYAVSGIPINYLIDPNGKIIAKNLKGFELNKRFEELIP